MQEVNGGVDVSISQNSMSMSMKRQIGEELIVDKINKIFDEVAKDRDQFEESYLSSNPKFNKDKKATDKIEAS